MGSLWGQPGEIGPRWIGVLHMNKYVQQFRERVPQGTKFFVVPWYSDYEKRHLSFFIQGEGSLVKIDWLIRQMFPLKIRDTNHTHLGLCVPHEIRVDTLVTLLGRDVYGDG